MLVIRMWAGCRRFFGNRDPVETYKQTLASILPPEMLTRDGFLKTPTGEGEKINISAAGKQAYYSGGLGYKAIRHQIEKSKELLSNEEYAILRRFVDQRILCEGNEDAIEIGGARHKGVLPHETFHDIQGYLYDYYPEIMEKLFISIEKQKDAIKEWYNDPSNIKYTALGNYQLAHLFPGEPGIAASVGGHYEREGWKYLEKATKSPTRAAYDTLSKGRDDIGRNETIPHLLGAASEGNTSAAAILREIFSDAGLKADFYATLPRFR